MLCQKGIEKIFLKILRYAGFCVCFVNNLYTGFLPAVAAENQKIQNKNQSIFGFISNRQNSEPSVIQATSFTITGQRKNAENNELRMPFEIIQPPAIPFGSVMHS